jgi:hypothetical protein
MATVAMVVSEVSLHTNKKHSEEEKNPNKIL